MIAKEATAGSKVSVMMTSQGGVRGAACFRLKAIEYDDQGKLTKGGVEAVGDVVVRTKISPLNPWTTRIRTAKMTPTRQTKRQ